MSIWNIAVLAKYRHTIHFNKKNEVDYHFVVFKYLKTGFYYYKISSKIKMIYEPDDTTGRKIMKEGYPFIWHAATSTCSNLMSCEKDIFLILKPEAVCILCIISYCNRISMTFDVIDHCEVQSDQNEIEPS